MKKQLLVTVGIVLAILLIDQVIKIYVKTHFRLGEEVDFSKEYLHMGEGWFRIHFTENPGMAFGLELGGIWGKLALSLFRLVAVVAIGYVGWKQIKKGASKLMMICVALIFAGALGNILDSCFYGLIFSESDFIEPAVYMPAEGGYAPFLHGRVVDMFYFPVIQGHFPDWFPIWGGEDFEFFRPVFNFADASISVGVILLIIFQKRLFGKQAEETKKSSEEETTAPSSEAAADTAASSETTS